MFNNLKELAVVLFLAVAVFMAIRPVCLRFVDQATFDRRRNLWLFMTVAAFLSPSFWIFAAVAFPVLLVVGHQDDNPAALYLLIYQLIPSYKLDIPVAGINQLFEMSYHRVLALAILIPAAWRLIQSKNQRGPGNFAIPDTLLVSYLLLQLAVLVPQYSVTHIMRQGFLAFLDTWLLYFVFSRTRPTIESIRETVLMFLVACMLMAPMGFFEYAKGWLLYQNMGSLWGDPNVWAYLVRGGSLRAQVSAGHALIFGFSMAVALGFALYFRSKTPGMLRGLILIGVVGMGLFSSLSRGPMLTAVIAFVLFMLLNPKGITVFIKGSLYSAIAVFALLLSPLGDDIIAFLPFVGTVDSENVTYRQRLFDTALFLIPQNLWFGDQDVLLKMEHLRQGQGIIDLINGYLTVVLFHGVVGLTLFVGFFAATLTYALRTWRRMLVGSEDIALLGSSLLACFIASLIFISTAATLPLHYMLAGLLVTYSNLPWKRLPVRNEFRPKLQSGLAAR